MPKKIVIPAMDDLWDEEHNRFISTKEQTLVVEHSLLSITKWEQKHKKAFATELSKSMSYDDLIDYIKCMTINNVDETVYEVIPPFVIREIENYISDPMTATTFSDYRNQSPAMSNKKVTSEQIYASMIYYGIPLEFEKRHINHLMALIRVCEINGGGQKKMSREEAALFQRSVNEKRRRKR